MANSEDDPIYEMGDIFQLSILEMLRRLCKVEPTQKSRLMNAIFMLSNSKSSSVLFECANTIIQLTTAPSAIKIAIQSYLTLLQDQNDNNVKLIVLNKIVTLKKKYSKLLEEYMNDILNIIREDTVQSVEINQKVLELVTDLANHRNVKEVGAFLENEIFKAKKMTDAQMDKKSAEKQDKSELTHSSTNEYRYLLIKCINQITQIYPETIPAMITPLMDSFLMFEKKGSMASLETIIFIREVIEVYPEHRQAIVKKLYQLLDDIRNGLVLRVAVWIIGEYSLS
jgi:coatomer subunit beta